MGHGERYNGPEPEHEAASGLWRSETMNLVRIHVQREAAHDTIQQLGALGIAQFRDVNAAASSFNRQFSNDVRRCEDAERRLRYFEEQMKRAGKLPECRTGEDQEMVEQLDKLEERLESLEAELKESNANYERLLTQRNDAQEYKEVLNQDRSFFRGESPGGSSGLLDEGGADTSSTRTSGLRYITGVLPEAKHNLFERLLYRATRGNMFFRVNNTKDQFIDPATGKEVPKLVFVVFFGSRRAEEKIRKICESQQISTYPYSIDDDTNEELNKITDQLLTVNRTIDMTEGSRGQLLQTVAQNIYNWKKVVITEKSIYNILNLVNYQGQTAQAECWVPLRSMNGVREALAQAEQESKAQVPSFLEIIENTKEIKPTYYKTNKVSGSFQDIIDAYGMARYKEVNPGVLTIVTFPFLFGIMFGDVGHAFIMTIFAALLCKFEKKLQATKLNEIVQMVFSGRYLLLFMGMFAFWTGFLYNDMFGIMIGPFAPSGTERQPSNYWYFPESIADANEKCDDGYVAHITGREEIACPLKEGASVYSFGIDPSWAETSTKLAFMNSLKMKMAVILGVGQMFVGECLQLLNHIRCNDKKSIWFRWLPEVVFLMFTFGYMDVMIVIKWLTNWGVEMANGHGPPLLLGSMTDFFLAMGAVQDDAYLFGGTSMQTGIQSFLLLCAVLSVPLLLLPIPIIEYRNHKNEAQNYGGLHEDDEEAHGEGEEGEAWDFSEIVIHQIIHTIEHVLGCVSNTASYLRLWALSLAHAELSEVFWNFAWMLGLNNDNGTGITVFFFWSVWFAVTIGVLLLMESLSAFLHALRLHWVEFNGKFYYGDGYKFAPYDIPDLIPKPFVYVASFKDQE
eukprot:TRINITY_DN66651_c1_g2_i1.p1 TRINITY_DN66651_c1_g2~~TRINITY_DN66651_c1_g2_i1.p1  ORF type:complete len:851 (+),score=144.57 TRINITY_DN66651_c1_g2_i1:143-2695(+)